MSDFKTYQLLAYMTAQPDRWRTVYGLDDDQPARSRADHVWQARLGRHMVRLGVWLQARYGALEPATLRGMQPAN